MAQSVARQWPALPDATPESLQLWAKQITRLLQEGAIATGAQVDALDDLFLTPAEGDLAYQPLDSDLTAVAALATTAFGRSLLTQADAAAALATLTAAGQGKQSIWVPALGMTPFAAGAPAAATLNMASGAGFVPYLAFDPTSIEAAAFTVAMPKSWNEGSLTAMVYWAHPATVTNFGVAWFVQAGAFGDDDTLNVDVFTGSGVSDTGGTTSDLYISAETGVIDPGNTQAEHDLLVFRIFRDPTNGTDTMAVDAFLIGVKLFYTTNAANDL